MAPRIMHIMAILPLILILKWMLKATANIKKPALPIMWILALNLRIASIKQANDENRMPK